MKAARIAAFDAAVIVEDIAVPAPGPGHVRVRVAAASLNPMDVQLRAGRMQGFVTIGFPYTMGVDLAGTIDAVGAGVDGWQVGDRVVARAEPAEGGALAEQVVLPASLLVSLPMTLSFADAAAVPTAAGTAYQALFETGNLKAGQTILIHAGAGGVGSFAIQFARAANARVIATASGDGIAIAQALGADRVIDHWTEDFRTSLSDLDFVLDTVGGETQARSFDVLRGGGTLVSLVSPPDEALAAAHRVTATFNIHLSDAARLAKVVDRIAGGMRVLVDRVAPLATAAEQVDYLAAGHARGKVILIPE